MNIINNKKTIIHYKICHCGDNSIGILVMKYYILGCIDDYVLNDDNFNIFKNIIKQVIFAVIYVYETVGFIHGDLHCSNILLKSKRNNEIVYNNKSLIIDNLEAVIMDFEKSKLNQKNQITDLIKNILKFITSIENVCLKNDYFINIDKNKIISLKSPFNTCEINYYDEIENIIEQMYIYQ